MSQRLKKFIVSFDAFGEPIAVNRNGETSHKTAVGALFSIALKSFILFFASTSVLALLRYQDPQITQVSSLPP